MLEGDWGSLPGPRVASVGLSDAHGVRPALSSGDTMTITFDADTDRGGTPLGSTVNHPNPIRNPNPNPNPNPDPDPDPDPSPSQVDPAVLEAGLLWNTTSGAPPYTAAEARSTDTNPSPIPNTNP